jgi:uncharacterized membrane protein (UPF0127 family)
MRMRLLILATLSLAFTANGCALKSTHAWAEIDGQRFNIEIADNPELRERGLMFRRELAPDTGMLFIHDDMSPIAYWMKNTYIPLDILYFDDQRKLVSAQLNVLPCGEQTQCPIYPSAGPAQYVLEINAGLAESLRLKPGDLLSSSALPDSK